MTASARAALAHCMSRRRVRCPRRNNPAKFPPVVRIAPRVQPPSFCYVQSLCRNHHRRASRSGLGAASAAAASRVAGMGRRHQEIIQRHYHGGHLSYRTARQSLRSLRHDAQREDTGGNEHTQADRQPERVMLLRTPSLTPNTRVQGGHDSKRSVAVPVPLEGDARPRALRHLMRSFSGLTDQPLWSQ